MCRMDQATFVRDHILSLFLTHRRSVVALSWVLTNRADQGALLGRGALHVERQQSGEHLDLRLLGGIEDGLAGGGLDGAAEGGLYAR